jgi:O-antigen/teichoic acid export membrane protein
MSYLENRPQSGHRYLLSVIGFSSTARTVTSVLTLISFPIALRAVGPAQFGVFVSVTALLNVVMCLADFGIAAAAGKAIAGARVRGAAIARQELLRAARLQAVVAAAALLPVIAVAFVAVALARRAPMAPGFLLIMVLATWIGVATNFMRSCLRSFLAFGRLAVLDAVESVVRTATWLTAAWLVPSALGLAEATLITAIVTSTSGVIILSRVGRSGEAVAGASADQDHGTPTPLRSNGQFLWESLSFLGMGLSTKVFQSAPFMIFGLLLHAEMVGVIGAFARLLELVSFPFLTLGNALAVRAHEVKTRGTLASAALWDACWRFVVVAAVAMGAFLLTSDLVARLLVPRSANGPWAFQLLSLAILTYSVACFIPTMSDFVGGLHNRLVFLGAFTLVEIPILWGSAAMYGDRGAVFGYLAVQLIMVVGYVLIAKRVFFGQARYTLPRYILESFGVVLGALVVSMELKRQLGAELNLPAGYPGIVALVIYLMLIAVTFFSLRGLRERFLTPSLFEFTHN